MERLMSLRGYVRQLRPITEKYISPVDKVQTLFTEVIEKLPQEKQIDVDSLVSAEDSTVATEMYEAAGVIVGMAGLKLSSQKISSVMSNSEFSSNSKKMD
jgi:hypothetical protein